jgi:fucose 4-O-acetylase-like acetyltransferase
MVVSVNKNISKRIHSLRFLLIVFVVFIHNNPTRVNFAGGTEIYIIPGYVNITRLLISNIIAGTAVPLLFLISGYLLYIKETRFIAVFKKKNKTILLPYILWHVLVVLFYYIAQSVSFTKPYIASVVVREFSEMDWLGSFTGKAGFFSGGGVPLVYQFWFLRDLYILSLAFIGIKKLADKFPLGTLVLCIILWTYEINIYLVSSEALLFFTLGYYIVKYAPDFKELDGIKMYDITGIYIITILLELFFKGKIPVIHKINIIIGSILFIKLTENFIKNERVYNQLAWLEKYTFFVYAVHGVGLAAMQKISVKIIPMHDGWILVQYFSVNIIGIIIFVIMGVTVKKLFPQIYGILTGGRML